MPRATESGGTSPGIVGDCGGCCSCATCHGYINADWQDKAGASNDAERALLEGVVEQSLLAHPMAVHAERALLEGVVELRSNSRLTCQIKLSAEVDGITPQLPKSQ